MSKALIHILQALFLFFGIATFARGAYVAYWGYQNNASNQALIALLAGFVALGLSIGMTALLSRRMPRKKRG